MESGKEPISRDHFVIDEVYNCESSLPVIVSHARIVDNESNERIGATAIVGVDLQQKGMQTPQAFGSASSVNKLIIDLVPSIAVHPS